MSTIPAKASLEIILTASCMAQFEICWSHITHEPASIHTKTERSTWITNAVLKKSLFVIRSEIPGLRSSTNTTEYRPDIANANIPILHHRYDSFIAIIYLNNLSLCIFYFYFPVKSQFRLCFLAKFALLFQAIQ